MVEQLAIFSLQTMILIGITSFIAWYVTVVLYRIVYEAGSLLYKLGSVFKTESTQKVTGYKQAMLETDRPSFRKSRQIALQ